MDTDATDVESDLYYFGAANPVGSNVVIDGQVLRILNCDQDRNATGLVLRSMYNFSKRTATYAQIGYVNNSDNAANTISQGGGTSPAVGASQIGILLGLRHIF